MKIKLLLLSLLFSLSALYGQQKYIIGNVKNEALDNIPQTYIYNTRTEELVVTNTFGDFFITAIESDELRVVKSGFERITLKINKDYSTQPIQVIMAKLPYEIEEVMIGFRPTGDLKKDIAYFKTPVKVEKLNAEMSSYMRTPYNEVQPQASIPSMFQIRKPGQGQISLLSIGSNGTGGALTLLGNVIKGKKNEPIAPNTAEIENFYRKLKQEIDISYYTAFGLSEYDFDIFLVHADKTYAISKNYHHNFNISAIETVLKIAFKEYLKTYKKAS